MDNDLKKEALIDIGDILPQDKNVPEKFSTIDSTIPGFLVEASYSPDETAEQSIQKDWERLTEGLSDYVLAEQLTERELTGMGKPLAENYAEYFHTTLAEVRKGRKKAEQRLFKLIPRHSQLDTCEFFFTVREQNEKEMEARERSLEVYPQAGVAKLDRADNARKGLKKEAARPFAPSDKEMRCTTEGRDLVDQDAVDACYNSGHKVEILDSSKKEAAWTAPEARDPLTNADAGACASCSKETPASKGMMLNNKLYCMPCHDAGQNIPEGPVKASATCGDTCEGLTKEANAKWKPGQYLAAKHNGASACVAYVNEDNKTYIIKVDSTMYPSYYSYEDAYNTFDALKLEETKDAPDAKMRGLS